MRKYEVPCFEFLVWLEQGLNLDHWQINIILFNYDHYILIIFKQIYLTPSDGTITSCIFLR